MVGSLHAGFGASFFHTSVLFSLKPCMWFHTEPVSLCITSVPPSTWLPPLCLCGCTMARVGHLSQLKANQLKDMGFDHRWISGIGRFRSSTDVYMLGQLVTLNLQCPM